MIQHLTFLSLFVRVVLKPRVFIPPFILTLKTLEGKTKVKKHNKQQKYMELTSFNPHFCRFIHFVCIIRQICFHFYLIHQHIIK